jgi:twitching motility protein PilT
LFLVSFQSALIDLVNTRRAAHVVTTEDPVENQHSNRSAIIEQIEVGRDTPDFAVTLRSVARQTPDVILVGEMRDAQTMATALTAAETGHLVLSTPHTNDAIQAVSRILDAFPAANQPQIRQQLSLALAAVIAEQLVPGVDGVVRWPATEVMIATDAVRAGSQGRRPPAPLADLGGPRRWHDDHGAVARRFGAGGPHYARDGPGPLLPHGRFAAVSGVGVF